MAMAWDAFALRSLSLARRKRALELRRCEARISSCPLIRNEAYDLRAGKCLPPSQPGQLDQECEGFHRGPQAFEQPCGRGRGAARSKHVVDDQNALTPADRVRMNLQSVGSIFERVLFTQRIVG